MLLPQNDFGDGFATLLASLAVRWKELGVPTEALIWVLDFLDIENTFCTNIYFAQ